MSFQKISFTVYHSFLLRLSLTFLGILVATFILLEPRFSNALPSSLSGEDYIEQCASYDVPIPPIWGSSDWTEIGELGTVNPPDASFTVRFGSLPNTVIYTYEDPVAPGTCLALRRPEFSGENKDHIDIICLGIVSSKACFWEGEEIEFGAQVPLEEFNGGRDLLAEQGGRGLNCTSCHAGENPFIIHPGTPLSNPNLGNVELNAQEWYDPIVPVEMLQNAGPLVTVATGGCYGCHRAPDDGGIGRFPKISTALNSTGGWCQAILENATVLTMPPKPPFEEPGIKPGSPPIYLINKNFLQNMCFLPTSPQIRIEQTELRFGNVQVGSSRAMELVIHNDGDATLHFMIKINNSSNPAWSEITTISNISIAPGEPPAVLRYVFEPQDLGPQSMEVVINFDGDNIDPSSQIISLSGTSVAPFPIDTVLLLDRSFSMADNLGGRDKINALRVAANLYADLLRVSIGDNLATTLGLGVGDRLGMVKYNGENEVHLPIETANPTQRISETDIGDPDILAPVGLTGIGGAMQTAASMLFEVGPNISSASQEFFGTPKQVMIVLTDGIETTGPFINDVLKQIHDENPTLLIYSVGLGNNVNADKLQNITNVSNGYHQVSDDLSGLGLFNLEKFYFEIFADATERGLVFIESTPSITTANLTIPTPQVVRKLHIDSSTHDATFLILDDPALRTFYDLELVGPDGEIIKPGTTIQGLEVTKINHDTYQIYQVIFAGDSEYTSHFGDWSVRLSPTGKWSPQNAKRAVTGSLIQYLTSTVDPTSGTIPVGFIASVDSDFNLEVAVKAQNYEPFAEILMTASLSDRQLPVVDANIEVTITLPNNTFVQLQLYDDATHGDLLKGDGIWSNRFGSTRPQGVYKFLFRSSGTNDRGDMAFREATKYVTIFAH